MSRKPETTYAKSIHRLLPHTYILKMHNPYTAGIPDYWFSGVRGDMWIEYKWEPSTPSPLIRSMYSVPLSALQRKWLDDRLLEDRNVAVIVGCPGGGVMFGNHGHGGEWNKSISRTEFNQDLMTKDELANEILAYVGHSPCLLQPACSSPPKSSARPTASSSPRS